MKFQLQRVLRIIFFGTGKFAAHHLYVLINCTAHKIIAIFTQEQKAQNFHKNIHYLSINQIAQKYNLCLFQSNTLNLIKISNIIKLFNIDIIIVVSYGLILSKEILNIPKLGCINVHGSLLPRWRGPAPIQRALEHGDTITGISIIQMDSGIDTGDILCNKSYQILTKDTSYTLSKKLATIGSIALLQTLEKIISKTCKSTPQNSLYATYAYKLNKSEARINWNNSAIELERRIRAFNPWPISYFQFKKHHIKVWNAEIFNNYPIINKNHYSSNNDLYSYLHHHPPGTILIINSKGMYVVTGSGIIILTTLQIPGKKKTAVKFLINSYLSWFPIHSILE